MDERTRAATYQDVLEVARLLESEGVEYALIGGYALALQGIVRLTEDIDILVEPTEENAARWVRALSKLHDGAARELLGDTTLHTAAYAIRINDEGGEGNALGRSRGGVSTKLHAVVDTKGRPTTPIASGKPSATRA